MQKHACPILRGDISCQILDFIQNFIKKILKSLKNVNFNLFNPQIFKYIFRI
jgi:hypothetical protein